MDKIQSSQCFGGNNTAGEIGTATALNARGGVGRMDFESETFVCTGQGWHNEANVAGTLRKGDDNGGGQAREDSAQVVTHSLRGDGFDASEDGTGRGTPLIPVTVGPLTACGGTERKHGYGSGQQEAEAGHVIAILAFCNSAGATALSIDEHTAPPITTRHGDPGLIAFDTTNITSRENRSNPQPGDPCHSLTKGAHAPAIAFRASGQEGFTPSEIVPPLTSTDGGGTVPSVVFQEAQSGCHEYDTSGTLRSNGPGHDPVGSRVRSGVAVRRLTPTECEKLMGMPVGYTQIPYKKVRIEKLEADYVKYLIRGGLKPKDECFRIAADGPRYRSLGNSWAVPCISWIFERMDAVDKLLAARTTP